MVKVSFCSTVYNNANIIEKTLNDLLKFQKYNIPFEIVIVDNFSNDGTWEILKHFKERYPTIFKLKRYKCNRGLGRYISIKLAKGDVIVTFDCDTRYPESFIKLIYKLVNSISEKEIYWAPHSIITKRNSFKYIAFRSLNWCEDTDLVRQAISNNFKFYMLCIGCAFNEIVSTYTLVREKRYSKTKIGLLKRTVNSFMMMVRVRNPLIKEVLFDIFSGKRFKKICLSISFPIILVIKLFKLTYYSLPITIEVLKSINRGTWKFLLPEDVGLDKNLMFYAVRGYILPKIFELFLAKRNRKYIKYYKNGNFIYLSNNPNPELLIYTYKYFE